MNSNRILILDRERISLKLQRMAFQIWECNSHEREVTLIGIEGAGVAVAESLGERLRRISDLEVEVCAIRVNKKHPHAAPVSLRRDLDGKSIILVDDVANSGKTLLYALRPLLDHQPSRIMIAVLVDRKHKAYPITPDIVGHSIATTLQEMITVELEGSVIHAAYLE